MSPATTTSVFRRDARGLLLLLSVLSFTLPGATACSSTNRYVWASSVAPSELAQPEAALTIRPGDTLAVVVEAHDNLNGTPEVTSDGFIVLPLAGPLKVSGKSLADVQKDLENKLKRTIEAPHVSVVLVARQLQVSVLGEVRTPGKYAVQSQDGIPTALALAGGLTEFAGDDDIYIVRASYPSKIRFRLDDLTAGGPSAIRFVLKDGDLIVVE